MPDCPDCERELRREAEDGARLRGVAARAAGRGGCRGAAPARTHGLAAGERAIREALGAPPRPPAPSGQRGTETERWAEEIGVLSHESRDAASLFPAIQELQSSEWLTEHQSLAIQRVIGGPSGDKELGHTPEV